MMLNLVLHVHVDNFNAMVEIKINVKFLAGTLVFFLIDLSYGHSISFIRSMVNTSFVRKLNFDEAQVQLIFVKIIRKLKATFRINKPTHYFAAQLNNY